MFLLFLTSGHLGEWLQEAAEVKSEGDKKFFTKPSFSIVGGDSVSTTNSGPLIVRCHGGTNFSSTHAIHFKTLYCIGIK